MRDCNVSIDAAQLCVRGSAAGIKAEGYEPLLDLPNGFLENGVKVWLCLACVKAKGDVRR